MDEAKDDLFLTDAQLVKLTGRSWKSKQIKWLRDNGISFTICATGHPRVLRDAVRGAPTKAPSTGWTPKVLARA